MATRQEIIDDVISLTAPREEIVSTNVVDSLLSIAEKEISATVEGEVIFFPPSESENAQRAAFWLTCLFVKVKTGEIEGARTTINDLELQSIRAEAGGDVVMWLREFRKYLAELQSELGNSSGFGINSISRPNRVYGVNSLYDET